jgi:uncharacterized protein YbjT (DUF2867 family)
MAKKTFAIMGATGHVGTILTEELLKKGHHVRALGRDKDKLQKLKEKGAETIAGAFEEVKTLTEAFKSTDAIFSFLPPAMNSDDHEAYQNKVGEAIIQALKNSGVQKVLNLSSIGAQLPSRTGPIVALYRQEQRLNAIPNLHVLHLRPGYFMENLFWSIPLIKTRGINGSAMQADLALPMVATRDIGLKAAEFLDALQFNDKSVFEFAGPQLITLQDATSEIGKAIGKSELKYMQFPLADAEKGMLAAGMKPKTVKLILEMQQAFNEGKIKPTQSLTGEHLGKTRMDTFAKTTFTEQYRAAEKPLTTAHR